MVYSGKPSRGCQNCKTRRIKCDETRPHCTNCTKTRRDCPGYPQEFDLIFRNENPGARKRYQKVTSAKRPDDTWESNANDEDIIEFARDGSTFRQQEHHKIVSPYLYRHDSANPSAVRRESNEDYTTRLSPDTRNTFLPPIEVQASTFFFQNFLLSAHGGKNSRGFLEVAAPMFDLSKDDSPVSLALQAIAVGIIANWPGKNHLAPLAAKYYGRALAKAQRAIAHPEKATSDATLLSILLFSLYESVVSSDRSVTAWSRHIEGAVAVVRARGVKQLENPHSLLLFRTTRAQMLTQAVQSQEDIPDFPGAKGWLSDLDDDDQIGASSLIEFSIRLPSLLSRAKRIKYLPHILDNISAVKALLREAREIARDLVRWEMHTPADWAYRSLPGLNSIPGPDNVEEMDTWPGPIHIYSDVNVSITRNDCRVYHMLCLAVVVDCVKWLDPTSYHQDEIFLGSSEKIRQLVDDICSSVPFHMWGHNAVEKSSLDFMAHAGAEAIGGYFVIWPLYTACSMDAIPPLQKRWMQGRLWTISRHYGIHQATIDSPEHMTEETPPTILDNTSSSSSVIPSNTTPTTASSRQHDGPATSSVAPGTSARPLADPGSATSSSSSVASPSSSPANLQGTHSIHTFVCATNLLQEMTRTMDRSGPRVPMKCQSDRIIECSKSSSWDRGKEVLGSVSLAEPGSGEEMALLPGSRWQNGMWAALRTMIELMGVG